MKIKLLLFASLVAASAALALPTLASSAVIASGKFGPIGKYTGKGTVTVVTGASAKRFVKLSRNFRAFNAVTLNLWLATSSSGKTHLSLGRLRASGAQTFKLPKSVNLKRYKYVIAWCVEFNVPITQAILR